MSFEYTTKRNTSPSFNPSQIGLSGLVDLVEQNNQVRFVEALVEKRDLIQLSFIAETIKKESSSFFSSIKVGNFEYENYLPPLNPLANEHNPENFRDYLNTEPPLLPNAYYS